MERAAWGNGLDHFAEDARLVEVDDRAMALRELDRRSRQRETILRMIAAQVAVALAEEEAARQLIATALGHCLN